MLSWRTGLERLFTFDPSKPIDQRDLMGVEQDVLTETKKAEDAVRAAHAALQQAHSRIMAVRANMRARAEDAIAAHAQVAADMAALG